MKSLHVVASLTGERDGEIRKAALNTLATAYKNIGQYFYSMLAANSSFTAFKALNRLGL
jgi:cytoskeleton-associated protein 5